MYNPLWKLFYITEEKLAQGQVEILYKVKKDRSSMK